MAETVYLRVPGEPKAQKRHRYARDKKNFKIRNYDPSSEDKKNFYWQCYHAKPKKVPTCAVDIKIFFHFSRPVYHYGSGKNEGKLKPSSNKHHIVKPDVDNLIKFVLDALTGLYWVDDNQIINISARKMYVDKESKPLTSMIIDYHD